MSAFGPQFVRGRLVGFNKDMQICLTPVMGPNGKKTAAYFPALSACCATLEYLAALHRGNLGSVGNQEVARFASHYLPQPDYEPETIRILFDAFRNPVAHRGISSGIWVDERPGQGQGRRLVWKITVGKKRPACILEEESGEISKDTPWKVKFTHRFHIHLSSLAADIAGAAESYAKQLEIDGKLQTKFEKCMKQMYRI